MFGEEFSWPVSYDPKRHIKMKTLIFSSLMFLASSIVFAQDNVQKGLAGLRNVYETKEVKPKIYLLGVFHFCWRESRC
jgi:hypothetical protein